MTTTTTTEQIRVLLAAPDDEQSVKAASELLEGHFKTLNDLQDLPSVLDRARQRHDELQPALAVSQDNLDAHITSTRTGVSGYLNMAQELSLVRHSLTDELAYLNNELIPSFSEDGERRSTLLEDIESLHRDLKELHCLKDYVLIIEHAVKLSETSTQQIQDTPVTQPISSISISQYSKLQDFVRNAVKQSSAVEDGAGQQTLHLVSFLQNLREKTWRDMKGILSSRLLEAAEALQWPRSVDYAAASPDQRRAFEIAFVNLLKLQSLAVEVRSFAEKEGIYPIQTLIHPISLRFKFHFESSRQTNKLDKVKLPPVA
ncbi:hypothetical protein ONZ45_g18302 [Pleurotus djamor]|nr:hypothetical protein ONZ45_g18302 [Pleurotus djamor]